MVCAQAFELMDVNDDGGVRRRAERILLEKSPTNIMLWRFLRALWRLPSARLEPRVRFLFVARHPLAVAEARADYALMHSGTCLWDTCAPEALVRAAGGKVTDLFGSPLCYVPEGPAGVRNALGVVASIALSRESRYGPPVSCIFRVR